MAVEPQVVECPVCASSLAGAVDVCTKCGTPHHQDCASFLGRCAYFGCGNLDFITLDVAAASLLVSDARFDETLPEPTSPYSRAPSGRLHRGVLARSVAALRLLGSEPQVSFALILFLLAPTLLTAGVLGSFATLMAQALLVICFSARARGKQSTMSQALGLMQQRAGRIIRSGLAAWTLSWTPLGIGLTILATALFGGFPVLVGVLGGLVAAFGLWMSVNCCLVLPIAAMDPHEEPEGALGRSAELVSVGRGQAAVSALVLFVVTVVAPLFVPILFGTMPLFLAVYYLSHALISLFSAMYWFLFYLEARKALGAGFLPHAPTGYLPPVSGDEDRR